MKDVFTLYDEAGKLVIKKAMVQHIKVFLDEQGKGKAEKGNRKGIWEVC